MMTMEQPAVATVAAMTTVTTVAAATATATRTAMAAVATMTFEQPAVAAVAAMTHVPAVATAAPAAAIAMMRGWGFGAAAERHQKNNTVHSANLLQTKGANPLVDEAALESVSRWAAWPP